MGGGGQFPGLSPGMAGMLGSIGNLVDADNAIMSMMNDLLIPLPIGQHGGKTPEQLRQELCNLNNALAAAAGALIRDAGNGLPRSELNKHAGGLATNLANLISAAKLAAAANGGDISLLDGAKAVSDALKELMNAAGELADNPSALSKGTHFLLLLFSSFLVHFSMMRWVSHHSSLAGGCGVAAGHLGGAQRDRAGQVCRRGLQEPAPGLGRRCRRRDKGPHEHLRERHRQR
jgi:hypothetical protein